MTRKLTPIRIKANPQIKAIFTLYGENKTGKTATLRYLFYLLIGKDANLFQQLIGSKTDFRAKLQYKGKTILLSTLGDNENEVDFNWLLFCDEPKFASKGKRNYISLCNNDNSDIVISPTHLKDASAKKQDMYIAKHKSTARFILYFRKRAHGLVICDAVKPETWKILINDDNPSANWNDELAFKAIHTAEQMQEQIDLIIKNI